MEAITTQLEKMRIRLGEIKEEAEDVIFYPKKALIAGNKTDLANARENYIALKNEYEGQLSVVTISAKEGNGLEELKLEIFKTLDIIRVYTKVPGQKPDFIDPIILKRGSTVEDAAAAVHKDFLAKLKYVRVWGSGKHDGLMAKRSHILQDGDVIELHL